MDFCSTVEQILPQPMTIKSAIEYLEEHARYHGEASEEQRYSVRYPVDSSTPIFASDTLELRDKLIAGARSVKCVKPATKRKAKPSTDHRNTR